MAGRKCDMTVIYAVSFGVDGEGDLAKGKLSEAAHAGLEVGARAARLWQRTFGSFEDGTPFFVLAIEFVDRLAMANYSAKTHVTSAFDRVHSRVVASELPLERGPKEERGSVLEVELTRPVPGRWRDALQASQNGADFHHLAGAVDCRLWHLDIGGIHSRHLVFCAQYADLHSWSTGREDAIRHPDTRSKAALMLSSDPPLLELRSDVFCEVHSWS